MKKILLLALLSISLSAFAINEPLVIGHEQTQIAFYNFIDETPAWVNPASEGKKASVLSTPTESAYVEMSLGEIRDYVDAATR